jgi:sterol O-acyltransferase
MAESTSVDTHSHNGHGEHHSPRPRKPTRIDFLKPQLSDEFVKQHLEAASGVSRSDRAALTLPNMC